MLQVYRLSSIPLLAIKPLVKFFTSSPEEVLFPEDGVDMNMHYVKLRFALNDRDISYLGTIFITTLESMFFYLEENWEMFCNDIEKGTIDESIVMPDHIRKKLLKKCKPDPERAEELFAQADANAKAKYERLTKFVELYK